MRVEIFENRIIKPFSPKVKDGWYELTAENKKRSLGQTSFMYRQRNNTQTVKGCFKKPVCS